MEDDILMQYENRQVHLKWRKLQTKSVSGIVRKHISRKIPTRSAMAILRPAGSLALFILSGLAAYTECQNVGVSVSQISPKSMTHAELHGVPVPSMLTKNIVLESTITALTMEDDAIWGAASAVTIPHLARVERSANPILNENYSQSGANDIKFPSESDKPLDAGRYLYYQIKPTESLNDIAELPRNKAHKRSGKTLEPTIFNSATTKSSSFLLKGDHRALSPGSPISPSSSIATSNSATINAAGTASPDNPRQNSNPDIQDIITGIVKLLNGNVNVHANTQGLRRPIASRINNRGPPRISEAQPLPMEYESHKLPLGTSMRPMPPYPFDRPERPFITGVPLPEQIVPHRPGFVSNQPPWHRKKPRPPITTMGGRRPVPQYKPLPTITMDLPPDNKMEATPSGAERQPTHSLLAPHNAVSGSNRPASKPLDITDDSEFSNEDSDTQYIEVSDGNGEKPMYDSIDTDMRLHSAISAANASLSAATATSSGDSMETRKDTYTTIVATSSEIHTVTNMMSKYATMSMILDNGENIEIDPSAEEVIFMTPSRTPILESSEYIASQSTSNFSVPDSGRNTPTIPSVITTMPIKHLSGSQETTQQPEMVSQSSPAASSTTAPMASIQPMPGTTKISTTATKPPTITAKIIPTSSDLAASSSPSSSQLAISSPTLASEQYHPRPGIVLDDPEFKPVGRPRPNRPKAPQQRPDLQIQPTQQNLPPGYGEIFDITLSAIQGPGSAGGSQQTINIRPYGGGGAHDTKSGNHVAVQQPTLSDEIILSAAGEESVVSIDGRRTYINLFGEPTDSRAVPPAVSATALPPHMQPNSNGNGANSNRLGVAGATTKPASGAQPMKSGYGIPETEIVDIESATPHKSPLPADHGQSSSSTHGTSSRPHYRPRPTPPPVRIDTCIVGDDSTCDQTQHERCKTDNGISSCHCRPGYSRRKHREPCRRVLSFFFSLRVDRIYEHRIVWDNKLLDQRSEPYGQLSYESVRAIESAMSMTPYSDEFMQAKVNNVYYANPKLGGRGVFVNITLKLDESIESLRPNLRTDVQKHLLGVLHRRNNNIGNSVLYVTSPEGAVSALNDIDECQSNELNDCHARATCTNAWGNFRCTCADGLRDPWLDQVQRAGRDCQSCPDSNCNGHGVCSYSADGTHMCVCDASHYGSQCEIDGEVLGVAIGASVAAVIIIVLTLVCLIMWSRRWQREQKNAIGSPVFGYMNTAPLKSAVGLTQPGYQVTLEDRMRWAQIADVMAQTNHYGAEPIAPTRPSSAMFAYPNIQSMVGIGSIGAMSMQNTLQQMHQAGPSMTTAPPPVPLSRYERLNLPTPPKGLRMENSSSSEEEDRTDLLGRNFQVPRPKSRSNGSVTNQSGIYYDVDYEPSNNGMGSTSVEHLYNSSHQNQTSPNAHIINGPSCSHMPSHGIPLNTYKQGRTPSYYAN